MSDSDLVNALRTCREDRERLEWTLQAERTRLNGIVMQLRRENTELRRVRDKYRKALAERKSP